ncbi:MAG: PilZ domain-containing protein [Defluviitaleaceae bacterium]|nr:PilZ domain-containing protein [Defluviitaleaceae bacterium]
MYLELLKSGARVQIQRPTDGPNDGYTCKVEVLLPESRVVLVHAPVEQNKPVYLKIGGNLTLRLLTDGAIYRFNVLMMSYGDVDGFDVVKLRILDEGEKIQRRSAFRFNCGIPVTYSVIYASGQQAEREEGLVSDLSAGGAKIFTNKSLHTGYLLNISIPLGEGMVVAFGDVRSKTDLPQGSKFSYQYGIRFVMMPEADQEQIIQFMYKMQREMLKKARPRQ